MDTSLLARWGFDSGFSRAFASLARPDLAPARVISDLGPSLEVIDAAGEVRLAQPSGRLRHTTAAGELPAVGDWVALGGGAIHHVLPRRTQLARRIAGRESRRQIIAANVDTVFVVTSANRDASVRRLERYLAVIWDSGATPVVIVSKIDLVDAALTATLGEIAAAAPGVAIAAVSAHTGAGLAEVAHYLEPGRTVALVGSSGVGKSSLVNCWLGRDHQDTLPVDANDRGRHATTRRELFALPGGALVIDTPGMRELGLVDGDAGLADAFADIARLAARCRFRDCRHAGEPGCAVADAIDAGTLEAGRLGGMHKLERELAVAERRHDRMLARAERSRVKSLHKGLRARTRLDPKQER